MVAYVMHQRDAAFVTFLYPNRARISRVLLQKINALNRVYKRLRMEGETARLEKNVALGIEAARGKPQSAFGIPLSSVSPSNWNGASKLLRAVGSFTLPCDKVAFRLAECDSMTA